MYVCIGERGALDSAADARDGRRVPRQHDTPPQSYSLHQERRRARAVAGVCVYINVYMYISICIYM